MNFPGNEIKPGYTTKIVKHDGTSVRTEDGGCFCSSLVPKEIRKEGTQIIWAGEDNGFLLATCPNTL